jgi:hypothetical protein
MTYKEQLLKEIEGINEGQAKRLIKVIEEIRGEDGKREEKKQVKFGTYNLGVKGRLTREEIYEDR